MYVRIPHQVGGTRTREHDLVKEDNVSFNSCFDSPKVDFREIWRRSGLRWRVHVPSTLSGFTLHPLHISADCSRSRWNHNTRIWTWERGRRSLQFMFRFSGTRILADQFWKPGIPSSVLERSSEISGALLTGQNQAVERIMSRVPFQHVSLSKGLREDYVNTHSSMFKLPGRDRWT